MVSTSDVIAVAEGEDLDANRVPPGNREPDSAQNLSAIEPPHVPAVFLSSTKSDPLDSSLLRRIAEEFSEEVRSNHLMPSSPEYWALWEESRTKADDEFRNLFGADELERARQSSPSP
jgi:hypothetical protein